MNKTLTSPPTQDHIGEFLEAAVNSRDYQFGPCRRVFLWDNSAIDWRSALLLAEPGDLLRVTGHGAAPDATILIEIPKLVTDITKALELKHEMLRWTE